MSYYYTRDHLGSVREMVDNSGTIQARYDYDPYGRVPKVSGSMDSDFQYAGYYEHAASGLNLTWYRAYDSNTAKWLSRDPLEHAEMRLGPNLYEYVYNNPINATDPFGEASTWQGTLAEGLYGTVIGPPVVEATTIAGVALGELIDPLGGGIPGSFLGFLGGVYIVDKASSKVGDLVDDACKKD